MRQGVKHCGAHHGNYVGVHHTSMNGHFALHLMFIEWCHACLEVQLESYTGACPAMHSLVHDGGTGTRWRHIKLKSILQGAILHQNRKLQTVGPKKVPSTKAG